MEFALVDAYLNKLYTAAQYKELDAQVKQDLVFTATEMLTDEFEKSLLSPRIVGLQTLYILEGEGETFSMLKRHGVKTYSVKGISVTLDGSDIAPSVIKLLTPELNKSVGHVGYLV